MFWFIILAPECADCIRSSDNEKPPVHQDGGCSMPMEILFSEISLAAHRSKTLVFDQGTLPLHWQVARLLFGVIPDVERIMPNPRRHAKQNHGLHPYGQRLAASSG
jgi:hypothetical protein